MTGRPHGTGRPDTPSVLTSPPDLKSGSPLRCPESREQTLHRWNYPVGHVVSRPETVSRTCAARTDVEVLPKFLLYPGSDSDRDTLLTLPRGVSRLWESGPSDRRTPPRYDRAPLRTLPV